MVYLIVHADESLPQVSFLLDLRVQLAQFVGVPMPLGQLRIGIGEVNIQYAHNFLEV